MDELRFLLSGYSLEPWNRFTAMLIVAVLVSRALDFLSTWIVTPKLELEANPLARQAGLARMALLNLLLLGLPVLHHGLSISLVVTSLLVAGTNLSHGAMAAGMGERRQVESQVRALRRIGLGGALLLNSAGSLVVCGAGVFMVGLVMAELPSRADHTLSEGFATGNAAGWAAMGVVMFGVVGLVHVNTAIVRLHRTGKRGGL